MTFGEIFLPAWEVNGFLPSVSEDHPTSSRNRSPYHLSLLEMVEYFGFSPERCRLLEGLLDFRAELHQAGLIRGVQWINGSFVENVEAWENLSPNDIDIVTFYRMPNGHTQQSLLADFPTLFDGHWVESHALDTYFVFMNPSSPESVVRHAAYWYSLWFRTRGGSWKGFLEGTLGPTHDAQARVNWRAEISRRTVKHDRA